MLTTDVWQVLQGKLLSWAAACSSIHVISGAILDFDHNGFRDNDEGYNRYDCSFMNDCITV